MSNVNMYLKAACNWLQGGYKAASKHVRRKEWNWDEFAETAAGWGILPSLEITSEIPESAEIPEQFRLLVETVHAANRERNQTALDQVAEVSAALNQDGIEPVALKGIAYLLAGIYKNIGNRFLADIDLLVPERQVPRTIEICNELGYATGPVHSVENQIGHAHPALLRNHSLELDIHRYVGLGICRSVLPAHQLIQDSIAHELAGATIRIPSTEDLVTHQILHSQMHGFYRERIWISPRNAFDLILLTRPPNTHLDWEKIKCRFRAYGEIGTLRLYVTEVENLFKVDLSVNEGLSLLLRARLWRRHLLCNHCYLRWADPAYYYFAGWKPRTRRVSEILEQPDGWKYLLQKATNPRFYERIREDFR